jgi:uncharacterized protein YbcI
MRIFEELVIVRSFGVFTPAEKQLTKNYGSCRLVKGMRQDALQAGRTSPEEIVQRHTEAEGVEVVSIYSDISTKSREWLVVLD